MYRILVVEDDEALARGIEFTLAMEKWQVKCVGTIEDAKDYIKTSSCHLVLLDVMLPDGDGFELCRELRKYSDIPVIFLTALDEEVNIVQGLDIGADDYVTKPFRIKELTSRIKAVLRRKTILNKNNRLVESGVFALNPHEMSLTKNNTSIQLTPIEFKLLCILINNRGQVMKREKILEKLWDINEEFIDDNTLSVHIRRLREKIEDIPSSPSYIKTVRGAGYMWSTKA